MILRKATANDIEPINALYQILSSDMAGLQPSYFCPAEQDREFLRSVIEEENSDILLAAEGENILGFALVQLQDTPPYPCVVPHSYTYLMDIIVHPEQRKKGIGKSLLDTVALWAREHDSDYIELGVLSQNKSAIRLYEQMNFQECARTMRLEL